VGAAIGPIDGRHAGDWHQINPVVAGKLAAAISLAVGDGAQRHSMAKTDPCGRSVFGEQHRSRNRHSLGTPSGEDGCLRIFVQAHAGGMPITPSTIYSILGNTLTGMPTHWRSQRHYYSRPSTGILLSNACPANTIPQLTNLPHPPKPIPANPCGTNPHGGNFMFIAGLGATGNSVNASRLPITT